MLIFWKERLVFLATTKTGSTAIEAALQPLAHAALTRPPELKHLGAMRYRAHLGPMLEELSGDRFTLFALIREPVDWLGSWYRYRTRDDLGGREESTRGKSFEEAALDFLSDRPSPAMAVGSQAAQLCGDQGRPLVDRLFRYEDMGSFIDFLQDRLDFDIHLPRLNISPSGDLGLTAPTRARLEERFAPDYALWRALG